jgi:hypothetical protein
MHRWKAHATQLVCLAGRNLATVYRRFATG